MKIFLVILFVACLPGVLGAQTDTARTRRDTVRTPDLLLPNDAPAGSSAIGQTTRNPVGMHWNEDSLIAIRTASSDTLIRPKKSATIAMLASMVVPGAGQIYNGAYWKVPIVWGAAASFYAAYHFYDTHYKTARQAYAASVHADTLYGIGDRTLQDSRNYYFDRRNGFGWYLAITYLITIVDAYVDASLYNFEVSPDLQPHGAWKATLHIRLR